MVDDDMSVHDGCTPWSEQDAVGIIHGVCNRIREPIVRLDRGKTGPGFVRGRRIARRDLEAVAEGTWTAIAARAIARVVVFAVRTARPTNVRFGTAGGARIPQLSH